MTAINLPGQVELPIVVDHKTDAGIAASVSGRSVGIPMDVQIAKLLQSYEDRPTSETWSRIQALAKEILR